MKTNKDKGNYWVWQHQGHKQDIYFYSSVDRETVIEMLLDAHNVKLENIKNLRIARYKTKVKCRYCGREFMNNSGPRVYRNLKYCSDFCRQSMKLENLR